MKTFSFGVASVVALVLSGCGGGNGGGDWSGSGGAGGGAGPGSTPPAANGSDVDECSSSPSVEVEVSRLLDRTADDGVWRNAQLDETHVFWTSIDSTEITTVRRMSRVGGPAEVIAEFKQTYRYVVDGDHLFMRVREGVQKVSKDGSSSELLARATGAGAFGGWIAVDADFVYVAENESWECEKDGKILVFDKENGEQISSVAVGCPQGFAVDGNHVYYVGREGEDQDTDTFLGRMPAGGGEPEVLAAMPINGYAGLVLNDADVYFVGSDPDAFVGGESLMRVPKAGGVPEKKTDQCTPAIFRILGSSEGVLLSNGTSYTRVGYGGETVVLKVPGVNSFHGAAGIAVSGKTLFQIDEHSSGNDGGAVWSITLP